jgi:fructose-1,6-bisphosphatase I
MKLTEFLRINASEELAVLTLAAATSSITVWESIPFKSGLLDKVNPSGERQKAIDVFSNDVFTKALNGTGAAAEVASEEMADPVESKGKVSVAMDPLDGSSNVETNNPLGSIFGFYSSHLPSSGRSLVGALYVTYGGMLTITLTFGKGVHRFVAVREGAKFSFELMGVNLKLPDKAEVYGIGGPMKDWIPEVKDFVDSLADRGLRIRYCGTFVGDYNQVLSKGGVFAYPKLLSRPQGKLRVLYETAPVAYINEQAGGYSTDGRRDILDIDPNNLSESSPAYLGSADLVRELERKISSAR